MEGLAITHLNNDANFNLVSKKLRDDPHSGDWDAWLQKAAEAVEDVRRNGVQAVMKHNSKHLKDTQLIIELGDSDGGVIRNIDSDLQSAIEALYRLNLDLARTHFSAFEKAVSDTRFDVNHAFVLRYRLQPIERLGIYCSPRYVTTALHMLALSRIAGVKPENTVFVTYPRKRGEIPEGIAYAAQLAGLRRIYQIHGRYAIASLAVGLGDVFSPVDMIIGPGSPYVDAAKRYVQMRLGTRIDLPAGPSESAVLIDGNDTSENLMKSLAHELVTQLEHGEHSRVFLLTTKNFLPHSSNLFAILKEIIGYNEPIEESESIAEDMLARMQIIDCQNTETMVRMLNALAPEYAIIMSASDEFVRDVTSRELHAASVLVNLPSALVDYSPETCVSPTWGLARSYSKLTVHTFLKIIPIIKHSDTKLDEPARRFISDSKIIASYEGMKLHRSAIEFFGEEQSRC